MAITPSPPPSQRRFRPFEPHFEIQPDIFGLLRNPRAWWANFQRQLVPVRARTLANRALLETNPRQAMLGFAQQIFGNIQSFSAQMGLISNLFILAGVTGQNPLITGLGLVCSSTAHVVAQEEATQRELLEQVIRQLVEAKNGLEQTNQALKDEVTRLSQITDLLQTENRNLGQSVDRFTRHIEQFEQISTSFQAKIQDLNQALDRHSNLPWHNPQEQFDTLKSSVHSFDPILVLFIRIFQDTEAPLREHQDAIELELDGVLGAIEGLEYAWTYTPDPRIKAATEVLLMSQLQAKRDLETTQQHLESLAVTYEKDGEKIEALKGNWSALADKIQQLGLHETGRSTTPHANRELAV